MKSSKLVSDSDDDSTEELIIKDDDSFAPSGVLSTEPNLNYVVKLPRNGFPKRYQLNKILSVVILLLLLACIILLCLYFRHRHVNDTPRYCTSSGCVESAAFINAAVDETVDPCNDFYVHACGGWHLKNPIPEGKSRWGIVTVLIDQNQQYMRLMLEKTITMESAFKGKAEDSTFNFYQSCKNMEVINKLGAQPLVDLLNRLGNFTKDGKNKDISNILSLLIKMHDVANMSPFFTFSVRPDDKDSVNNILKVGLYIMSYCYV